jgi:O-antigen/teichoic acid export membrane protein
MVDLMNGLNKIVAIPYSEYNKEYKKYFRWKIFKSILLIMLLILSIAGYFLLNKYLKDQSKLITYSVYIVGFILIFILLYFLYSIYVNREIECSKYKTLIMKQNEVEEHITNWNKRNGNKLIIIPIAFQYIQFSYNNIKVFIENHDIYY